MSDIAPIIEIKLGEESPPFSSAMTIRGSRAQIESAIALIVEPVPSVDTLTTSRNAHTH